ncbi:hypothetical protein PILCRDRAFT_571337 [Piloderma croceum F 1598]|uniref:Uncharacterized protein n=1 Tax=Piloderma croceum (strain F 1598) TaxID=765440 RepID=A0A0C3AYW6_PILCF|nr:hypothetical protein PILCRDRAFT_571337 [Piloderma croceum F 1598]
MYNGIRPFRHSLANLEALLHSRSMLFVDCTTHYLPDGGPVHPQSCLNVLDIIFYLLLPIYSTVTSMAYLLACRYRCSEDRMRLSMK